MCSALGRIRSRHVEAENPISLAGFAALGRPEWALLFQFDFLGNFSTMIDLATEKLASKGHIHVSYALEKEARPPCYAPNQLVFIKLKLLRVNRSSKK